MLRKNQVPFDSYVIFKLHLEVYVVFKLYRLYSINSTYSSPGMGEPTPLHGSFVLANYLLLDN